MTTTYPNDQLWRCQHGSERRGYAKPVASCALRTVSECAWQPEEARTMMTDRQFDKLENAIAAWQAAGLDVVAALRAGGEPDVAEQMMEGLKRTADEMSQLRRALRPSA